ncbi:restriction endonuclease [Methylomonas koyamae]|uniref:restriction endonuclease n=1 Tax=Methylomonas koyamae TaxID=702114 RepID=UPI0028739CC4|nr:restriction endonuclease [Methylomonas koyamae]WNB74694.1 restriction endonuclease [Methylomonas koyamae]
MNSLSTEYEILVRDLHAALVANDCVENVNVLHNVKLKGRSGATHQIDVYWEFKVAGVKYKTCIECKHYNHRVKKSDVASFIATLDDIGNATGIFATTVGYQSGAVLLAKDRGVRLLTINHLLKSVNITSNFIIPDTTITDIKYDTNQARQLLIEKKLDSFSLSSRWGLHTMFFDATGNPKISLRQFINQNMIDGTSVIKPEELYEQTDLGLLRVTEIHYKQTTSFFESSQEITVNDATRAIMEDVLENYALYLHDDSSITQIET